MTHSKPADHWHRRLRTKTSLSPAEEGACPHQQQQQAEEMHLTGWCKETPAKYRDLLGKGAVLTLLAVGGEGVEVKRGGKSPPLLTVYTSVPFESLGIIKIVKLL